MGKIETRNGNTFRPSRPHRIYRVVLKRDGDEVEIGSIGIQDGAAWAWGIDTVIRCALMRRKGKAAIAGTA